MPQKYLSLDDRLYAYLVATSVREPEVLAQLRQETAQMPMGRMQISPDQGQFMGLLVQLIGARKTLEVGVFTGYSALAVALALPPDGKIIACDIDEKTTAIARRYWVIAGVEHKIDLRIAPALETLNQLLDQGGANSFDCAFIDADKRGYDAYYEAALALVRPGGLILIDNVLWSGRVADPSADDLATQAIRALNQKLKADQRVTVSLVPIGDGLTLAVKR
ncbi:MAG: class I SAM-dependent methyltransferase [Cyanobacteria bacterium P01_C01_bin.73]